MSDNNILQYSECLITSCDYRVRYVPHPSEEESAESPQSEEKHSAGFRLWSTGPNFDTDLPQDVTGIVGHTAYLTCRVFDRTNSTVSSHLKLPRISPSDFINFLIGFQFHELNIYSREGFLTIMA